MLGSLVRQAVLVAAVLQLTPLLWPSASAAATGMATWNAKVLPVPANDVVYDPTRGMVLAVVPGTDPSLGNELVELHPDTGMVGRHVFVGSEPSRIALTADGSTAYIGLWGVDRIARVDLTAFTMVGSFSTGAKPSSGPRYVEDLEAVPGRNDTVVASLMVPGYLPRHQGVFVFQDGVALPDRTQGGAGASRIVVADPTTAYGYNNQTSEFGFRTLAIGASGVSEVSAGPSAITDFGTDIELAGGRVYSTTGIVLEPGTRTAVGSYSGKGLVEVTLADNRTTFLSGSTLASFNATTGQPVESRSFPQLADSNTTLVATGTGYAVADPAGVVLVGPSVGGGPVTVPPAPPSTIGSLQVTSIALAVADIAYDESRGRVYASVPSSGGERQDQVVALDPATGAVVASLFVGSNPGPLALSSDRSRLHVGLSRTGAVAQLDLASFSQIGAFTLGTSPYDGIQIAEDIEVLPGTVDTIAVSLRACCTSPRHLGVAVYDRGVARPNVTPGHTGANRIEFGSGASTLYGTNNETTGFEFYKMAIDAAGVTRTATTGDLLRGFGTDIELVDGLVYASGGRIADPDRPELVGSLPASGAVEVLPARDRAYVLDFVGRLVELELGRQRLIARRTLGFSGYPTALVAIGGGGFVASLNSGRLLFLNPAALPAVTGVEPASGSIRGGTAVTIRGTGFQSTASVSFGSATAQSFSVVSDTEIRAVTPPHAAGQVPVVISNAAGSSTSGPASQHTYVAVPPAITSVGPSSGSTGGGTQVTIRGSGFQLVQSVGFGSAATTSFNVVSSGEILALTPPHAAGEVAVAVTTADGTSADAAGARFTYIPPSMVALNPSRLLETRTAFGQVGYSGPKPAAGQVIQLPVAGRGGIPATGASAVVLNLTATEATAPGFVTAWACGTPRPNTASVVLERTGHTIANLTITGLGTDGKICLSTSAGTHLVADATGWFPT